MPIAILKTKQNNTILKNFGMKFCKACIASGNKWDIGVASE